ncbi:MAG TPA: DEAD/DEAH box helicase [Candidatus Thermoplasmatota archaeon]|nr:DEAD/DEAH box helicase [Candidatus Thermoplasmatota archaeon]
MPSAFDLLGPSLRALLAAEGFERPTAAQEAALPAILGGHHVLLIAPTGMGKTESAMLPLLELMLRRKAAGKQEPGIQMLYITPLRALNRDLLGRLKGWGERLGLEVAVRHGDTPQSERLLQSRRPPAILITTPETVQVLLSGRRLRFHLQSLQAVVVDEVHELAEDERGAQLAIALERIVRLKQGEFQRVGLSATVGNPEEVASFLGGEGREVRIVRVPVAKRLQVVVESPDPTRDDQIAADKVYSRPDQAAYLRRCHALILEHKSTLLFVNTRETAEVLTARTRLLDPSFPLAVHHGSLSKDARISAEEDFKQGRTRGLVCTSSMELGIDIGSADLVIQYNSPRQVVRLVQRVGRAGHRADLVSNGVILATDPDDIAEALVIARRALHEEIESHAIPERPLDVLANQLVAIGMDGVRSVGEAFDIVKRARPFRGLELAQVEEVAKQLHDLHLVWLDEGGGFRGKRRSFTYFFENLSMIPDEKSYPIIDISSGRAVAKLDEGFVRTFIEPNAVFICQGRPWRVVEQDDEKIRVEPVLDPVGAIPSWVGEEIPVPFEVAREVGALRAGIAAELARGPSAAEAWVRERYPASPEAARKVVAFVLEQGAHALPTDALCTLEVEDTKAILNLCAGTKVNETIGRILSTLLTARLGASVGLTVDPYRIILDLPTRVAPSVIEATLRSLEADKLPAYLDLVLGGSSYLRWRLFHVARRFGAIGKGAEVGRVALPRLLEIYRETPLYTEAMREVLADKLDVPGAARVLSDLRGGALPLQVQSLSPVGLAGVDQKHELISPARADRAILLAVRKRLVESKVILVCTNCEVWRSNTTVQGAPERPSCGKCGAISVAVLRPWERNALKAWEKNKDKLTDDERKEWRRLQANAGTVMAHGKRGMMCLVARGVGPETAGRILMKQREDELSLLRDILEAEVTYARTRQFWD